MKKILLAGTGVMLIFSFVAPVFAQVNQPHPPLAPPPPPPTHNVVMTNPDPAPLQPHVLAPAIRNAIEQKIVQNAANSTSSKASTATKDSTDNTTKDDSKKKSWFQTLFSDWGVQFLALCVSLIGVGLAISGFSIAGAKKKKHMSTFMNDIDDAFHSFKWKSKRCEAELYRLHDMMEEKLKQGKLDESSYGLLSARIDKYLKEIHEIDGLPEHLKKGRGED